MNSKIYVPKLVPHPAKDANAESSTENMHVESSRRIESPPSHNISYKDVSKIHFFMRDLTQTDTGLERDQNHRLKQETILFLRKIG